MRIAGLDQIDTRHQADEGAWIDIQHPVTAEPLELVEGHPVRMLVLGADGAKWRKIAGKLSQDLRRYRDSNVGNTDPDKEDEITRKAFAKAIIDWEGLFEEDDDDGDDQSPGVKCEVTADNALRILQIPAIFEQVNQAMVQRRRFTKGGSHS